MIPIKGYATFHPLKHCWIGSGFQSDWFHDLPISKNQKIMDPLKRIAEETEEDYQQLEKILGDAGVKTYRSFLDINKVKSLKNVFRPPINPRDHFAVIGEKLYAVSGSGNSGYGDVLKQIARNNLVLQHTEGTISTATICRVGKDIWWDNLHGTPQHVIEKYKQDWVEEGFRVHLSNRGHHLDGEFCVVKPGCIVTLCNVQNYKEEFPGWDVLYLPDQSWSKVSKFLEMKDKVGGRWFLRILSEWVTAFLQSRTRTFSEFPHIQYKRCLCFLRVYS